MLIAVRLDHRRDRHDGDGRASAEPSRRGARRKAALVGKPLQGAADTGAVDTPRADTADHGADVKHGERCRRRVDHPRGADQHRAEKDDRSRAEAVHEPSLDRHEPRLGDDEDREGHLHVLAPPMMCDDDRIDEEGPTVLQVGNHRHAEDADGKLHPAVGRQRRTRQDRDVRKTGRVTHWLSLLDRRLVTRPGFDRYACA